jgi:dienelactone hydrolase
MNWSPSLAAAPTCFHDRFILLGLALGLAGAGMFTALAQPYAPPDRGEPGDAMIQSYLRTAAEKAEAGFLEGVTNAAAWERRRLEYKQEYLYMLGLWPLPAKTPLQPKVTGRLEGEGYRVEMLHYQSRPFLYVTANLYRPAVAKAGEQLPAVLYVCGHSNRGRDGNKTAYQSHGIWFARHGYVCLMVDTLQLGEIAGIHHGTYREGRWWWHSRGYTPAGVECWNGVRGIDYLVSRPDVDAKRIAVTGISGGGAATFWIAAADERVSAAVPVSGMADLASYVPNRVINGHCDCMFLYNAFGWPWTRIAGLIAPRPLLFVNSDQDSIFPMDANERVINRLERLYSLFGAGDLVDSVVSVGDHAYRKDIRQASYCFINAHLKNDPRLVPDSEVDLVAGTGRDQHHPIDPAKLRVFPADADLPKDELNTKIDQEFVPMATVQTPRAGEFEIWRKGLLEELHRVTFRYFPQRIPPAWLLGQSASSAERLETEPGIEIRLTRLAGPAGAPGRVLLLSAWGEGDGRAYNWITNRSDKDDAVYLCEPRGLGETRWTRKNPPNYVERAHALLGRTVDTGRVWDLAATARYLRQKFEGKAPIVVAGQEGAAVLAAYAALLEPDVAAVILQHPALSHTSAEAPQFLNVLRVCDVPDVLGMLAPRPLTIQGGEAEPLKKVTAIYAAAGAGDRLTLP